MFFAKRTIEVGFGLKVIALGLLTCTETVPFYGYIKFIKADVRLKPDAEMEFVCRVGCDKCWLTCFNFPLIVIVLFFGWQSCLIDL